MFNFIEKGLAGIGILLVAQFLSLRAYFIITNYDIEDKLGIETMSMGGGLLGIILILLWVVFKVLYRLELVI